MASSGQAEAKLLRYLEEHVLECSICAEQYDDPKTLNCQHTFCRKCIDEYINRRQKDGLFECPMCRTSHPVPHGGAEKLSGSVVVKSILEAAAVFRSSDVTCTSCVNHAVAVIACYSCGDFLCRECKRLHDNLRVKQSHATCGIEELKVGGNLAKFQKSRFNFCDDHPGEMKKLFCNVHNSEICTMCSYEEEHKRHTKDISTLSTKVNSIQEEIRKEVDGLVANKDLIKTKIKSMEETKQTLEQKEKDDLAELDENIQSVSKLINDYAAELRCTISQVYSQRKEEVESAVQCLRNKEETLQLTTKQAAILDELPLCNVLLAAIDVRDKLKTASYVIDDFLDEDGHNVIEIPAGYISPALDPSVNESLKKDILGRFQYESSEHDLDADVSSTKSSLRDRWLSRSRSRSSFDSQSSSSQSSAESSSEDADSSPPCATRRYSRSRSRSRSPVRRRKRGDRWSSSPEHRSSRTIKSTVVVKIPRK